jgi:hypothetical protein
MYALYWITPSATDGSMQKATEKTTDSIGGWVSPSVARRLAEGLARGLTDWVGFWVAEGAWQTNCCVNSKSESRLYT